MTDATLSDRYCAVRKRTEDLCAPLSPEDMVVQSMPDASPAKWHAAHTTWFFERMLLCEHQPDYRPFHPRFNYLFNSYYLSIGSMHPRPERGLLTRPSCEEIWAYRAHVDGHVLRLLNRTGGGDPMVSNLIGIGLAHEEQHQELLLTDLKHALSRNPLLPTYQAAQPDRNDPLERADRGMRAGFAQPASEAPAGPRRPPFVDFEGGIQEVGHGQSTFAFDNECPRHQVLVRPFRLAQQPVSCGEYSEFIADGGYQRPEFWLSDGWAHIQQQGLTRPLYWQADPREQALFTLHGQRAMDPGEPVCHLSYFEADAFASWAGARLPTEFEWEVAATQTRPTAGNLGTLHPSSAEPDHAGATRAGLKRLLGDVWEWTSSAYGAYPGFRKGEGSLGEYNGKFMCGQFVLRGGSCATAPDHIRLTYRNFFPPTARWQFSGMRLAKDL